MKKIILTLITLLCLTACGTNNSADSYTNDKIEAGVGKPKQKEPEVVRYLVESKYTCPKGYMMWVSNINFPTNIHRIEVGKYTYEHTAPGDTIKFVYR